LGAGHIVEVVTEVVVVVDLLPQALAINREALMAMTISNLPKYNLFFFNLVALFLLI